jgi:hypothetical protein
MVNIFAIAGKETTRFILLQHIFFTQLSEIVLSTPCNAMCLCILEKKGSGIESGNLEKAE